MGLKPKKPGKVNVVVTFRLVLDITEEGLDIDETVANLYVGNDDPGVDIEFFDYVKHRVIRPPPPPKD